MNDNSDNERIDTHEAREWSDWLESAARSNDDLAVETRDNGGLPLLDLVAAFDYLSRGHRHDLTIGDALAEALRWWITDQELVLHGAPDPDRHNDEPADADDALHDTLHRFVDLLTDPGTPPAADALAQAIHRWTSTMAQRHNRGYHWPHPVPRRAFPPPSLVADRADSRDEP